MKIKTKNLLSVIGDGLIFALVVFSLIYLFIVGFPSATNPMAANDISVLKFYTIQSNILMGVIALISLIYKIAKKKPLPFVLLIIRFIIVTAVVVTFLTTMLFLLPTIQDPVLVTHANVFLHIITPIVSLLHFVFLEDKNGNFKFFHTLFSISSVGAYGAFYLTNIVIHNGYGNPKYDWYGFGKNGLGMGLLAFAVMLLACWGVSLLIYLAYKKINLKVKEE